MTVSIAMVWAETALFPKVGDVAGSLQCVEAHDVMLPFGWKCRCVDEALIVGVVDIGACLPLAV